MKKQYSASERHAIVKKCLNGKTPWQVEVETGIDHNLILDWVTRFQVYGVDGLYKKRHYRLKNKEKLEIISEFEKHCVPLHELCIRYNVSRSTIKLLLRRHREKQELDKKIQLRRSALKIRPVKGTAMGRPKKLRTEEDILRERIVYLEAENALLKKSRP